MEASPLVIPTIKTGVEVDQQTFLWEINNFDLIVKDDELINSQLLDFTAGESIGQLSKWTMFLQTKEMDGKKWIGVFYRVKEPPVSPTAKDCLYTRMSLHLQDGEIGTEPRGVRPRSFSKLIGETGWGLEKVIDVTKHAGRKRLGIRITFKLYSQAKPVSQLTVEQTLKKFQLDFSAKAHKDLGGLLENPVAGDMKMLSRDGVEFSMPKGVLAARSPVLGAMLRADMTEVKDGVIRLPDITGKTLKIYLNFLYTGELLPEWKDPGVIVELTNVAAKYQHSDLLQFLDSILGKVCDLENAVPLWNLASKLSLKIAETELLNFIKNMGFGSSGNFAQIVNAISAMNAP